MAGFFTILRSKIGLCVVASIGIFLLILKIKWDWQKQAVDTYRARIELERKVAIANAKRSYEEIELMDDEGLIQLMKDQGAFR